MTIEEAIEAGKLTQGEINEAAIWETNDAEMSDVIPLAQAAHAKAVQHLAWGIVKWQEQMIAEFLEKSAAGETTSIGPLFDMGSLATARAFIKNFSDILQSLNIEKPEVSYLRATFIEGFPEAQNHREQRG